MTHSSSPRPSAAHDDSLVISEPSFPRSFPSFPSLSFRALLQRQRCPHCIPGRLNWSIVKDGANSDPAALWVFGRPPIASIRRRVTGHPKNRHHAIEYRVSSQALPHVLASDVGGLTIMQFFNRLSNGVEIGSGRHIGAAHLSWPLRSCDCTSAPLSSRCLPTLGGVPVTIPLTTSNNTSGLSLSTFR